MYRIFTLCLALLLINNTSFAKIWRVNNNSGVAADFTTAQEANDAAQVLAGDTIHLEPSVISYGSLNTNKRLVWLSVGNFLGENPGMQYASTPGKVDNITINSTASNSTFSISVSGSISMHASSTTIDRCYVQDYFYISNNGGGVPANNIIINSFIGRSVLITNGSNQIFTNNIIGDYIDMGSTTSARFVNNVLNALNCNSFSTIYNSAFQNNIFNKSTYSTNFYSCSVENNMSSSAHLPQVNNNQNSIDMSAVFVNASGTTDKDFMLKNASPAIAAGIGGIDMGAFGGFTPFKLALIPSIPSIYKIVAPVAPAGTTMNVTFSTKSNN